MFREDSKLTKKELGEVVRNCQPNYGPSKALGADEHIERIRQQDNLITMAVQDLLGQIAPYFNKDKSFECFVVNEISTGMTFTLIDGSQAILIGRQFVLFVKELINYLTERMIVSEDGEFIAFAEAGNQGKDDTPKSFGMFFGSYLELGLIRHIPKEILSIPKEIIPTPEGQNDPIRLRFLSEYRNDLLTASIEFLLVHEVMHGIAGHSYSKDWELTGYQDYCRLRFQEFHADRRAVALLLERRKKERFAEIALLGAEIALLALSLLEQFNPSTEKSLVHPGCDTRLFRIFVEEAKYWTAAGLARGPRVSLFVMRQAFNLQECLEHEPKLLWSPINSLLRKCTANNVTDSAFFFQEIGKWFAECPIEKLAYSLGRTWGSVDKFLIKDEPNHPLTLSNPLFAELHRKLAAGSSGARKAAAIIRQGHNDCDS